MGGCTVQVDKQIDGRMHVLYKWMYRWMYKWMHKWMNCKMDTIQDRSINRSHYIGRLTSWWVDNGIYSPHIDLLMEMRVIVYCSILWCSVLLCSVVLYIEQYCVD